MVEPFFSQVLVVEWAALQQEFLSILPIMLLGVRLETE
jgi:hypothetical protein